MNSNPPETGYQESGASFRDPSGFVFHHNQVLYRQINEQYQDTYLQLIDSGLYDALVEKRLLIQHVDAHIPAPAPDQAFKVIQPEPVEFISYPYEWSFNQLKDAALTTLKIQSIAIKYGMSLKDSSAYNIQFYRGRPVLIDTLSFESYQAGKPWAAYRQFCQHFLAPLSLMVYRDIRLSELLKSYIDGLPLDLASRLLPLRTRLNLSLLLHIHLHASSQKRYAGKKPDTRRSVSQSAFLGLIESLQSAVKRLKYSGNDRGWAGYYQDEHSYTSSGLAHKQQLVEEYLAFIQPKTVWDLGANTGLYSRLACDVGANTIAFDFDPVAVDLNYQYVKSKKETTLLPLVQDLTNPSPAIGWQSKERSSLFDRANADTILALALLHHIAIANNVSLDQLATFFQRLARWLIVEFIPKEDPQVQRLMVAREDIFPDYTVEGFESAFSRYFTIHRAETIQESSRRLYLMERL
jgi:ribosomal protein L11 methylase PrmA